MGIVIYEMLVGCAPFNGGDEDELLWNVCNRDIHYPTHLSADVKDLIVLVRVRIFFDTLFVCILIVVLSQTTAITTRPESASGNVDLPRREAPAAGMVRRCGLGEGGAVSGATTVHSPNGPPG